MSTRGYMGIQKKGELKGQYNHFDSYFSGLGQDIIKALNTIPKEELIKVLNETYDRIILVNEGDKPSQEIVEYCINNDLFDGNVSSRSTDDMYCLFRKTQGNLGFYLNGGVYMLNGNDFLEDDLFCEYGYIINLDTNMLELYENGNHKVDEIDLLNLDYEEILKNREGNN